MFDCLKMLLSDMILNEYKSKVLTQSDLAFLFPIKHEDKRNRSNSTLSMHFMYKLCTGLYVLFSTERHQHFQRLFILLNVLFFLTSLANAVRIMVIV